MGNTSPPPTWTVVEWDGPSEGPITFLVKSSAGASHTVTTRDALSYDFAPLNGAKPTMAVRIAIGQAIVTYTFQRAYLKRGS